MSCENTKEVKTPDRDGAPALLTLSLIRKLYLPQSDRTLRRWIVDGTFPRPDLRIGPKVQMWSRETVESWIEVQKKESRDPAKAC